MARIFKTPFGAQGDTEQVPETPQGDGSVSLTQGFGYDYEREYEDPAAKDIRREVMNGLFHDITEAIGDIQLSGIAKWSADAAPYPAGAVVWRNSVAWRSMVGNNSVAPTEGENWSAVVSQKTVADALATKADKHLPLQSSIPQVPSANTVEEALAALGALYGSQQFAAYSPIRTYTTGETCRGSDGKFYEFYDRDLAGTVLGIDPTDPLNRPHIWMEWDGVKPGSTIEWRSETLPEGYIENDGAEISRTDYRRVFAAFGTTYGAGDGSATFLLPDDRGEFKRGLDQGRGVDEGRSISAHQMDQFQGHTFGTSTGSVLQSGVAEAGNQNRSVVRLTDGGDLLSIQSDGVNGAPRVGDQTRARNNAVIYLTKI